MSSEAELAYALLTLTRTGRGTPESLTLIDSILVRWEELTADNPPQVAGFLMNALNAAGGVTPMILRLHALCEGVRDGKVLFNLACAWAVAGDEARTVEALGRSLEAGARAGQALKEPDLAAMLKRPAVASLLDRHTPEGAPFEVAPHLPALERVLERMRSLSDRAKLQVNPGASPKQIAAAEARAGRPFPNQYRALLTLHDGLSLDPLCVLGCRDFLDDTQLFQRAREYAEMSARYGTPELLDCLPIANRGQPNDWLVFDPKRNSFVSWSNADDSPHDSLAEAIDWDLGILESVLSADQ